MALAKADRCSRTHQHHCFCTALSQSIVDIPARGGLVLSRCAIIKTTALAMHIVPLKDNDALLKEVVPTRMNIIGFAKILFLVIAAQRVLA